MKNADRIGEILLRMRAVGERELRLALGMQGSGDRRPVGEILIDLGALTPGVLRSTLGVQRGLRSRAPHKRAMAAAGLAEASGVALTSSWGQRSTALPEGFGRSVRKLLKVNES